MIAVQSPRFQLGKVVATEGAIEALTAAQTSAWELLSRHSIADLAKLIPTIGKPISTPSGMAKEFSRPTR